MSEEVKILFVDDDQAILSSIERNFRRKPQWSAKYISDPQKAADLLREDSFDVLVSDFDMPGMNGFELMKIAKDQYPSSIRIMLSASEFVLTSPGDVIAHQVITKPWNVNNFIKSLDRILKTRVFLRGSQISDSAERVESLPSVPDILLELNRVLSSTTSSTNAIARVISLEPAMAAKMLQLANSAFFRRGSIPVLSITKAVLHLGVATIKSVATSLAIFRSFSPSVEIKGFSIDKLRSDSEMTAMLAANMFKDSKTKEIAFAAGLLRFSGILVLASQMPKYLEEIIFESKKLQQPIIVTEKEKSGIDHSSIGAYLLGMWGLPEVLVDAVAGQYSPPEAKPSELTVKNAVFFASAIIDSISGNSYDSFDKLITKELIDGMQIENDLKEWKKVAASLYSL
ncbi:MAG: HDOD domain-containing protein [Deltaproteobacteria bacterium]|nr:HDOD domain-containing protein [Deltaproteobacteria bacterium]